MIIQLVSTFLFQAVLLFVEMSPYLLIGFSVAGMLHVFVKRDWILKHAGSSSVRSVVKAAAFGVPLPLCSCAVVPASLYLKRAGASKPAVLSFLISTPQTGVDSIIATYGLMGPLFAVVRPVAALVTGIAGGTALSRLERRWSSLDKTPQGVDTPDPPAVSAAPNMSRHGGGDTRAASVFGRKTKEFARYAYVESVDAIAVQFLFGLAIATLVTVLVPDDFFVDTAFGSGLPAMLLMIVVGTPMYICATSSIPIAVALLAKGLDPGAAYVFLMAGPATNAATLAILSRTLGKRETILFLVTVVSGGLLFGGLLNVLAGVVGWEPLRMNRPGVIHEEALGPVDFVQAAVFGVLVAASLWRRVYSQVNKAKSHDDDLVPSTGGDEQSEFTVLPVEGMTCSCCSTEVEEAIKALDGIEEVHADHGANAVRFRGMVTLNQVTHAITTAGYEVRSQGAE